MAQTQIKNVTSVRDLTRVNVTKASDVNSNIGVKVVGSLAMGYTFVETANHKTSHCLAMEVTVQ